MTAPRQAQSAVVLLSGGLDSATLLASVVHQGVDVLALSFRYGQRHAVEVSAAREIARSLGVSRHQIVEIDLRAFGGSALTADIAVPRDRIKEGRVSETEVPVTYVPARNTIFLSYALALAEVSGSRDIYIGVNAVDYSGYPDCRPEYIGAFQKMANLATKAAVQDGRTVTIHTPLISMSKGEIISLGTKLGVAYDRTVSCYDPTADGFACGHCDSCLIRKRGFSEAGISDPTRYAG